MNFSFLHPARVVAGVKFRSEGLGKFTRCLILASAFFEFTAKNYPKAKHRFTLNGAPVIAIGGIWREGKNGASPAFAMLTTELSSPITINHSWC